MPRKSKSDIALSKRRKLLGGILCVLALLVLVSLTFHSRSDDARITGEVDGRLSPFEIQYRNQGGMMGAYIAFILTTLFGWLSYFVPAGLIVSAVRLFSAEKAGRIRMNLFLLFVIALSGSMLYNVHQIEMRTFGGDLPTIGGYMAEQLTRLSVMLGGGLGSYILLGGIVVILLWMYASFTPVLAVRIRLPGAAALRSLGGRVSTVSGKLLQHATGIRRKLAESNADASSRDEEEPDDAVDFDDDELEDDQPEPSRKRATIRKPSEPIRKAKPVQVKSLQYEYPSPELLADSTHTNRPVGAEELEMTSRMLEETLETFGVGIDGRIESYPGPVITRYEFKPAAGVKVNQVVNLSDDLALALRAKRIRIVAPIPGKAAVGVEIPNHSPQNVLLKDIITSAAFSDSKVLLPLALGKTISGRPFVADLAKMPHLLIAGATGSGKSVCINILITSLIYRLHPLQVRFIFIDPKMLELSIYDGIPHLGRPVVTKSKQAERVLTDLVREMENRYKRLADSSVRNIEDFNRKHKEPEERLPYIIVFVDELADLMMSATSSKTEMLITRLAQMARAVGIHLILATQRPSVDVITGLIKANFPARIAFQVSSKVDSRTIIDQNGAEKLLGAGDMLYLASGQPETKRIHGAWLSNEETEALVSFVKQQGLEMMTLSGISQSTSDQPEADVDLGDPLFKEACEVVLRHKQGSVSLLQRRLGIGYQRAARLIDKLEQAGIVSGFDGSKARDVVVDRTYVETLFTGGAPVQESSESEPN
jgi:S-DNA-T family DNA segregation ATPase FtsK/SpoIIIE